MFDRLEAEDVVHVEPAERYPRLVDNLDDDGENGQRQHAHPGVDQGCPAERKYDP
jgi:hypothetical protein